MKKKKSSFDLKKVDKMIFDFVGQSLANRGIPPTIREISKFLELPVGTVHRHLNKLRENGLLQFRIEKNRRVSRGLKIRKSVPLFKQILKGF
jgi:SOS-response transcriptional repressor LexA